MSPILFSIYINDILPERDAVQNPWDPKVEGLLFADDLCLFARTEERLRELMDRVSEWSDTWGMVVGADKCGVMIVPPLPPKPKKSRKSRKSSQEEEGVLLDELDELDEGTPLNELEGVEVDARDVAPPPASNWFLQGKEIAVVSSYKYLGLKITNTLD